MLAWGQARQGRAISICSHVRYDTKSDNRLLNCDPSRGANSKVIARLTPGLLAHRTDAVREYAYDTSFGRLDNALDVAVTDHWVVVDVKSDLKRIFSFE
jgi:hypothetical protein